MRQEYEAIYLPEHPHAYKDGMVYVHVLVAEEKLGRFLKPRECVHHFDGCKINNIAENLMIFASNSDHITYHNCIKNNVPFTLTYVNGVYTCVNIELDKKTCPNCGKPKSITATLCADCYKTNRRADIPPRKELKNKIRTTPFIKLGKQYGVSDNAVRKWCMFYNLPHKSHIIRKMSDEDWERI